MHISTLELEDSDPLAPARGVALGVVLGLFAWAILGAIVWIVV